MEPEYKQKLKLTMERHGAIPGDWRHFFDDLETCVEKNGCTNPDGVCIAGPPPGKCSKKCEFYPKEENK